MRYRENISTIFSYLGLARSGKTAYEMPKARQKAKQKHLAALWSDNTDIDHAVRQLGLLSKFYPEIAQAIAETIMDRFSHAPDHSLLARGSILAEIAATNTNLRAPISDFLKAQSEKPLKPFNNKQSHLSRQARSSAISARSRLAKLCPELAEEIFLDMLPHAFQKDHIHIAYQNALKRIIEGNQTLSGHMMLFFELLSLRPDAHSRFLSTSFLTGAGMSHEVLKDRARIILKRLENDPAHDVVTFAKMGLRQLDPVIVTKKTSHGFKPDTAALA